MQEVTASTRESRELGKRELGAREKHLAYRTSAKTFPRPPLPGKARFRIDLLRREEGANVGIGSIA